MPGVQTCALRSEEHTSELQSHSHLVCRLLLAKKALRSDSGEAVRCDAAAVRAAAAGRPTPLLDSRRGRTRPRLSLTRTPRVRSFFFEGGRPPELPTLPPAARLRR